MNKLLHILLAAMLIMTLPIVSAFKAENNAKLSVRDVKNMKENVLNQIPDTYDLTNEKITIPNRFILYTHDGKNIMWGTYGNSYFRGQDNNGKFTWGIYGENVFAGFYQGEFFWGKYRNNKWKANGIFGLKRSRGNFVTFPPLKPVAVNAAQPRLVSAETVASLK